MIVRGARQVGKSTLVQLFTRKYQKSLCNVNLKRYPEFASIFSGNDPEQILQQIVFLPKTESIADDIFLFLDEIQAVPEAIPALRYFYEDMPDFPVVSAGSLLSLL